MASIDQVLLAIASEAAEAAEKRVLFIEAEVRELRARLQKAEAECDAARLASQHVRSFSVKHGNDDYLCPRCYVTDGTCTPLHALSCTRDEEFFHCEHGHDIAVPYK